MESLEKNLADIQTLLKKLVGMPSTSTAIPKPPKPPTIAPTNQKNPVKVAQQIADPSTKKIAVGQAKEFLKVEKNGQWKLNKQFPVPIQP